MRRADVAVLALIGFLGFGLIVPGLVRMRHAAYGTSPADINMTAVHTGNFEAEVSRSSKPVVVVFYAGGFNQLEGQYWAELARRNPDLKLVGIQKGSNLWSDFDDGTSRYRAFLFEPRRGTVVPLRLIGDMEVMEGQIYGLLDAVSRVR